MLHANPVFWIYSTNSHSSVKPSNTIFDKILKKFCTFCTYPGYEGYDWF